MLLGVSQLLNLWSIGFSGCFLGGQVSTKTGMRVVYRVRWGWKADRNKFVVLMFRDGAQLCML